MKWNLGNCQVDLRHYGFVMKCFIDLFGVRTLPIVQTSAEVQIALLSIFKVLHEILRYMSFMKYLYGKFQLTW